MAASGHRTEHDYYSTTKLPWSSYSSASWYFSGHQTQSHPAEGQREGRRTQSHGKESGAWKRGIEKETQKERGEEGHG